MSTRRHSLRTPTGVDPDHALPSAVGTASYGAVHPEHPGAAEKRLLIRALTREIADPKSPVRRFLDERFPAVRSVQRGYREGVPPLRVEGNTANPATVGTAVDWLLRFLLHPAPDVRLAMAGAARYIGPAMMRAVADLASILGTASRPYTGGITTGGLPYDLVTATVQDLITPVQLGEPDPTPTFAGPLAGTPPTRSCWPADAGRWRC